MAYENKILRLIAGVKTRKEMETLFQYFKDHEIELSEAYLRTALNKFYMLPEE